MGRFKQLLCKFCNNKKLAQTNDQETDSQDVDVSYLTTPNSQRTGDREAPNQQVSSELEKPENEQQVVADNLVGNIAEAKQVDFRDLNGNLMQHISLDSLSSNIELEQQQQQAANSITASSSPTLLSVDEPDHHRASSASTSQSVANLSRQSNHRDPIGRPREHPDTACSSTTASKPSYHVISVREPLAKVLADRRNQEEENLSVKGEHKYAEVTGFRTSPSLYEEIADSTNSSSVYDRLDVASGHAYQSMNIGNEPQRRQAIAESSNQFTGVKMDLGESSKGNQDRPFARVGVASSSIANNNNDINDCSKSSSSLFAPDQAPAPIYSVINKTRPSCRADTRLPPPPPKNLIAFSPLPTPHYERPDPVSSDDHTYSSLEGSRSSCLYEEIPGSTNSSTIYDRIEGSNNVYQSVQGGHASKQSNSTETQVQSHQKQTDSATTSALGASERDISEQESSAKRPFGRIADEMLAAAAEAEAKEEAETEAEAKALSSISKQAAGQDLGMPAYSVIKKAAKSNKLSQV